MLAEAVLLVGCSELPKPFQDQRLRVRTGLAKLPDGGAITVMIDLYFPKRPQDDAGVCLGRDVC